MPYFKRNEKCKNASGESGAFVTIKKSGGERKCWKNKEAFKKSSAARHAKGIKKEMNITKEQLQKIILEEVEVVNREDNLSSLYLEAFAEHGINEIMLEGRSWFPTVVAGLTIGAVGALGLAVDSDSDAKASRRAAKMDKVTADLSSLDTKTQEMYKQINNFNAWVWSGNKNSTSLYPMMEFEELPGSKFTVMPPEYSVFLQVLKDKKAGTMRYGMPSDMEQIKDLEIDIDNFYSNINTDGAEAQEFMEDFNNIGYYDELQAEELVGKYAIGGQIYKSGKQMKQAQAILPDFDALEQVYNGELPLSGMSVEDTYNSIMFGPYLSTEEIEKITGEQNYNPDPSSGSQEIEEIIKEEISRYLNA